MSRVKYFATTFIWGASAKVLDAAAKFFTIPILVRHFGVDQFGLLSLAMAANAYIQLLDMGINTGATKYFSEWIGSKQFETLHKAARASLSFYAGIGIINTIALIGLALYSSRIFNLPASQCATLSELFFILAGFSIFNWISTVFSQLLTSNEQLGYIQKLNIFRSFATLGLAFGTRYFNQPVTVYFFVLSVINLVVIFPLASKSLSENLIKSVMLTMDFSAFKPIFKYSMAIFAMGIFQFTASQSRPLILSMFSIRGAAINTEYRIMEVFPTFILSIGGILLAVLLPASSRALQQKDTQLIEKIAYQGTTITTLLICVLCFPVMLSSQNLLMLYVGSSYTHLWSWLVLWCATIIGFMHFSPIASLTLASGKTKALVYSSSIACIISMIINALLCPKYGAGSAVIGYAVYISIQMSAYYLYMIRKLLSLNPRKVFLRFAFPTLVGLACYLVVGFAIPQGTYGDLGMIASRIFAWVTLFGIATIWFFRDSFPAMVLDRINGLRVALRLGGR